MYKTAIIETLLWNYKGLINNEVELDIVVRLKNLNKKIAQPLLETRDTYLVNLSKEETDENLFSISLSPTPQCYIMFNCTSMRKFKKIKVNNCFSELTIIVFS